MVTVNVFHKNVICLIKNVGAVAVRTIVFKIGILVHICVNRNNVILLILFVKRIKKHLKITVLLGEVVFKNSDNYLLFSTIIGARGKSTRNAAKHCENQKQRYYSFHNKSPSIV